MKNNITEIVFIIDKSGSMAGFEDDTIGGFNSVIAEHKDGEGKVYVSTVLFSNEFYILHDRKNIADIERMTRNDFRVGGCAALYDTISAMIHHIGNIHKYARPEDIPDRTLFFIMTDGMENASVHCDLASVKSKIERQRERYGWDFIFLAANIDTFETARSMGIKTEHAVRFEQTSEGMDSCFDDIMCIMRKVRKNEALDEINWTCEKK